MATVLIAGGTGMIGKELCSMLLAKGYAVTVLTRNVHAAQQKALDGVRYAAWNVQEQIIDPDAIRQADYIVNLAGENIGARRWTKKHKQALLESRINSCATLVKALQEIPNQVKAVVQASGVDWYPADPVIPNPAPFTEDAPSSSGFLGEVCRQWEQSIAPVQQLGKRLVILRTGIVLSKQEGALDQFKKSVRFHMPALLGNGRQMISWIHIRDICGMYIHAIETEQLRGVYNAVAPVPVSNSTLMLELARLVCGSVYLPVHVPAFVLKLILGEMGAAVLKSTTAGSEKISRTGFQFSFPTIEAALRHLLTNHPSQTSGTTK